MKNRKYSYQVKVAFALFCKLIALTLSYNSVKSLRATKIVKEIKFEEVWQELKLKKMAFRDNQLKNIWD